MARRKCWGSGQPVPESYRDTIFIKKNEFWLSRTSNTKSSFHEPYALCPHCGKIVILLYAWDKVERLETHYQNWQFYYNRHMVPQNMFWYMKEKLYGKA